jgi:hypothetical protein
MTKETMKEDVLQWTVDHFVKYGDNDIFRRFWSCSFLRINEKRSRTS